MAARGGYGAQNYSDYNMNGQNSAGPVDAPAQQNPYGYTDSGLMFLNNNADSFINASNTQAEWNREDKLRQEAYLREDTQLDRIVEAAKRNGINPIFLLDAFNQQSSASYATSAAKTSSFDTNAKTDASNTARVVGSLLAALAMIAAAAL